MTNYPKEQARQLVQNTLETLSPEEYSRSSNQALDNLKILLTHLQRERQLNAILLYKALKHWREIDVSSLEADFKTIDFDYAKQAVDSAFPTTIYDCIVVPLYGFDDKGYRLGHGGGWYDRLLARQLQVIKIGIGLESCRIDFVTGSHDIPMDYVVTDFQY